jgi:NADH-quinone oxidoreductase subunit C
MTDETKSGLDAVSEGPVPTDDADAPTAGVTAEEGSHPSVAAMRQKFGDAVRRHEIQAGDEHVVFVDPGSCHEILAWLKEDPDHDFAFCTDVTAVDYGGGAPIQIVYQLFSLTHHYTLRVKAELPLDALEIPTVADLWKTADWLEREVYDLFGVTFVGHPDLRRILMPHDYAEGHPLRKDFPLRGRFSRAEQTRRALMQEPEHFYFPGEMGGGRDPQHLTEAEIGIHSEDQG